MSTYLTTSPCQTKDIARSLAKDILRVESKNKAVVIALQGDLGSGKTTFLQGFAQGLGIKEKILSPTFVLLRRFKIYDLRFKNFYHIDCYRIDEPREILALSFRKIIAEPKNIVAVEWAEKIKALLPKYCLQIKFKLVSQCQRRITITRLTQ